MATSAFGAATVNFQFHDIASGNFANKKTVLTSTAGVTTNSIPGITVGIRREFTNDSRGALSVTNLLPGSYKIDSYGNPPTSFYILLTNETGTVNANEIVTSATNVADNLVGYSQAQANQKFVLKSNGTATGLSSSNTTLLGPVTFGGETRTNWPVAGNGNGDVTTAQLTTATNTLGTNLQSQVNGKVGTNQFATNLTARLAAEANLQTAIALAVTNNQSSAVSLGNKLTVAGTTGEQVTLGENSPAGSSIYNYLGDSILVSAANGIFRFYNRATGLELMSISDSLGVNSFNGFVGRATGLTNIPIANYEWMQKLMPTPLLAWDSWYEWTDGEAYNESNVLAYAQKMITNGMYAAGYRMIRLSDPWTTANRDVNGDFQWNTNRFPSGADIINQLHGLGYTVGLYSSYHPTITNTCVGVAGSTRATIYGDMKQFAAWGVDHVFMDACGAFGGAADDLDYVREYCRIVPNAVSEAGRPMTLTMVIARNAPAEAATAANILPLPGSWDYGFASSVAGQSAGEYCTTPEMSMTNARAVIARPEFYGPGHYVYWSTINFQQSDAQTKFNMSLASLLGSPLTVGIPITSTALGYMTNAEALSIHQDATLRPIKVASSNALAEVWYRPIGANADTNAVALINMSNATQTVTCTFTNLGLPAGTILKVRDVWSGTDLGVFTNSFSQSIAATNIGLYRLSPVPTFSWTNLTDIPAGFADGTDDGNGGGISSINGDSSASQTITNSANVTVSTTGGVTTIGVTNLATTAQLAAQGTVNTNTFMTLSNTNFDSLFVSNGISATQVVVSNASGAGLVVESGGIWVKRGTSRFDQETAEISSNTTYFASGKINIYKDGSMTWANNAAGVSSNGVWRGSAAELTGIPLNLNVLTNGLESMDGKTNKISARIPIFIIDGVTNYILLSTNEP